MLGWGAIVEWDQVQPVLAPVLVFMGVVGGWLVTRTKNKADIASLTVKSARDALESVLASVEPLKAEIEDLKSEVAELKTLNEQLVAENLQLSTSISQLQTLLEGVHSVNDRPSRLDEQGSDSAGR